MILLSDACTVIQSNLAQIVLFSAYPTGHAHMLQRSLTNRDTFASALALEAFS
jgi:hypothetical protein